MKNKINFMEKIIEVCKESDEPSLIYLTKVHGLTKKLNETMPINDDYKFIKINNLIDMFMNELEKIMKEEI